MNKQQANEAFDAEFPDNREWFEFERGGACIDGHFTFAEIRKILALAEAIDWESE